MALENYPELATLREKLLAERASILETVTPLVVARDAIAAQVAPLEQDMKALDARIRPYRPRLVELDNQLGAIAKATGGRSMGDAA